MSVSLLKDDRQSKEEWDSFVRTSPQGSIFSTTRYLDAIGARYEIYVLRKGGAIVAGIPITRGILGLTSNPLYCKYLGFILSRSKSKKKGAIYSNIYNTINEFEETIQNYKTFNYTFHPSFDNWLALYWMGFAQQTMYTYIMPKSMKDLWWDNCDSRLRHSVRRGQRAGLRVRQVSLDNQAEVEACYHISMKPFTRRNARPPLSRESFFRMVSALALDGHISLWLCEDENNNLVSSAAVLEDWKSAYFLLNGSVEGAAGGGNPLLISKIIENSHDKGLDFDFEGSMIRPIEKFYRSFCANLTPYYRIWKPSIYNKMANTGMRFAKKILKYDR